MGILSLIWGVLAVAWMFLALIPLLGWMNWLVIPFSFIGGLIGLVAALQPGRTNTPAIIGLVLCFSAGVVGTFRLILGGGVL